MTIAIKSTKSFCEGECQYFPGSTILAHTIVASIWLPILELWEELQILWKVTVVGTWLKWNIYDSGSFCVGRLHGIGGYYTYLLMVTSPYFFV